MLQMQPEQLAVGMVSTWMNLLAGNGMLLKPTMLSAEPLIAVVAKQGHYRTPNR